MHLIMFIATLLAHSAVHGAMAGYTGFTVGPVNGRNIYIPFRRVIETQNKVVITDRMWARLLCSTNQPSFLDHKDVVGDEKEEVPQIQSINGENHLEARATKHREPKDVTEDTREEEPPILLVNGNSHLEDIMANQK